MKTANSKNIRATLLFGPEIVLKARVHINPNYREILQSVQGALTIRTMHTDKYLDSSTQA